MASTKSRCKAFLLAILCGGGPLAMSATCDPGSGTLSVFRGNDDPAIVDVFFDGYYNDGYYEPDVVIVDDYSYDDCFFDFGCF